MEKNKENQKIEFNIYLKRKSKLEFCFKWLTF